MDPLNGARADARVEQRAIASALRSANAANITTLAVLHLFQYDKMKLHITLDANELTVKYPGRRLLHHKN